MSEIETFTFRGKTYKILPEYHNELPDGLPVSRIPMALKHIAIQKGTKAQEAKRSSEEKEHESLRDPLPDYEPLTSINTDAGPVNRWSDVCLIIDGNNMAHRCKHMLELTYKDKDVSILFGFLKSLQHLITRYSATCVVVCWDGGVPPIRKRLLPSYKAQRDHSDEDGYKSFIEQVNVLHKALSVFGVTSIRKWGAEADDLIYHTSKLLHGDTLGVVVSTDADLLQCIDYKTIVWSPVRKQEIGPVNFEEHTGGISRELYVLYRSMVGDNSDSLIGIKGIGETTASKLLANHKDSSAILQAAKSGGLSEGLGVKITIFGIDGFDKMDRVINLSHDICGAKYFLIYNTPKTEFSLDAVKPFLNNYGFLSLSTDADFYGAFRGLTSLHTLLDYKIDGINFRYPKMVAERRAVL
jgi:5'-3' exonuclease